MIVKKISLNYFRGFDKVNIDFNPTFNVIVGENGKGKTSVLDALRYLLATALPQLVNAPNCNCSPLKSDITQNRSSLNITIEIEYFKQLYSLTLLEHLENVISQVDSKSGVKKINEVDSLLKIKKYKRPKDGDIRLEGTLRGQTSEKTVHGLVFPVTPAAIKFQINKPLILYLSVQRSILNHAKPSVSNKHRAYKNVFDYNRGLEIKAISEWWHLAEKMRAEETNSRLGVQLKTVREALGKSLPEIREWQIKDGELVVDKKFTIEHYTKTGKQLFTEETKTIPLRFLSDGEKSITVIVLDIARRLSELNAERKDPCSGNGIVLIDEIDLHLHPKWQRIIVSRLKEVFPNIQFICTTHSPFVVQSVSEGELIKLDGEITSEFSNKSIEDVSEDIMGVEMPQKSKRYLEMITAAEQYYTLLRTADSKKGKELAKLKRTLDQLSTPYSDDAAYQALLKVERTHYLGSKSK